jgi:hypothetical protein
MPKANSRKQAVHHKKARAHHAVKAHSRRSTASKPSVSVESSRVEIAVEPEIVDEEFTPRSRMVDEDVDDDFGIYGPGRGETAG